VAGWLTHFGLWRAVEPEDPQLLEAIKRAIDLVEPRLEHVSGYPNRYREMALRALLHAKNLAEHLPGPIELNSERYVRDPFIRALFAAPNEIENIISLSKAMREYQRRNPVVEGDLFALMGMRYRQKRVFGMESQGEMIRRDVEQEVLSFEDHTLCCVGVTEAESRALLVWDVFDSLMRRVAQRLAALRQEKLTLDQKKDQLMARLRSASDDQRVGVQAELENLLVQQRELAALLDLQQVAKLFDEELQIPEDYVHLEQRQIQLDGMGVVRQSDEAVCSHPVDFTDLVGMDRRRWTVVLVRYRYQDSPSMAERMENASRWLYA
jgi:hypothetical protein